MSNSGQRAASKEMALFLAHAVELEEEARQRYEEMADIMASHHNTDVAQFFQRMAQEAAHHSAEVTGLASGLELPELKPWEFDWLDAESPETASFEAMHYRMSLRDAMALALGNEQAAHDYYQHVAQSASDEESIRLARQFADEELAHVAELKRLLAAVPEASPHHREEDDDPHMPE